MTHSQTEKTRIGYLLGTRQCGSTLISFLMNSHPQIVSVGEIAPNQNARRLGLCHYKDPFKGQSFRCSCGAELRKCDFWNTMFRVVQAKGVPFSADNWTTDYAYDGGVVKRLIDGCSRRPHLRWANAILSRLSLTHRRKIDLANRANDVFINEAMKLQSAQLFFDGTKSPSRFNCLRRSERFEIFAVRIIRDARAHAYSSHKRGKPVKRAAVEWRHRQLEIERQLKSAPDVPLLTIRYEDLCGDIIGGMQQMFSFFGLDPHQVPLDFTTRNHHIIGNKMRLQERINVRMRDEWSNQLEEKEKANVLEIAGSLNERYGYSN